MPKLRQTDVSQWLTEWRVEPAQSWPPVFRAVELDAAMAVRLERLGQLLDELVENDPKALFAYLRSVEAASTGFRAVMAQLGAARSLRLMHWLTDVGADLPDAAWLRAFLVHDPAPDAAALHALLHTERRRVVTARMFAPERLTALEAACADAGGDAGSQEQRSTDTPALKEIA